MNDFSSWCKFPVKRAAGKTLPQPLAGFPGVFAEAGAGPLPEPGWTCWGWCLFVCSNPTRDVRCAGVADNFQLKYHQGFSLCAVLVVMQLCPHLPPHRCPQLPHLP